MKEESVLNVLMYLFKYHMSQEGELALEPELFEQLEAIGFQKAIIFQAFSWVKNLTLEKAATIEAPTTDSLRVFSDFECELFDFECRRFLLSLEQQGILNANTREIVISQIMELADEGIDLGLVKWVTLIVLFAQSSHEKSHALTCMEFLVLDESAGNIH